MTPQLSHLMYIQHLLGISKYLVACVTAGYHLFPNLHLMTIVVHIRMTQQQDDNLKSQFDLPNL